jgi:hypothetical protein
VEMGKSTGGDRTSGTKLVDKSEEADATVPTVLPAMPQVAHMTTTADVSTAME